MMTRWMGLVLLAGVMSAGGAFGQTSAPTSAPASQPAEAAELDDLTARLPDMTVEEITVLAYEAITKAEARGPDAAEALRRVDRLITALRRRDPISSDADFLMGRSQVLLGRPREAIGSITSYATSRKGENDWLAFKLLGDLFLEAKYYTMARDKYQRATDLNPREAEPLAGLANAELKLNRPFKAVEFARKAIDLLSADAAVEKKAQFNAVLANALLADRKPDEAFAAASTAVDLVRQIARANPTDPALLQKLDTNYGLLEDVVTTTLQSFPERPERFEEFAKLARVQRERAEIAHLLSLHRILDLIARVVEPSGPKPPPSLLLEKARLLAAIGDPAKAAEVLHDLLSGDPKNVDAQHLLDSLQPATSGPADAE